MSVLDEVALACFAKRGVSNFSPTPLTSDARGESLRLGPYELLVEVAAGGMATVYVARLAEDAPDAPLVAIKRPHRHLAADKTFLTMLVDEARLASAIDHPNVAKVRELRFDGGVPFIVMDYVEGASLADLRRELGALGRTFNTRLAASIALDALAGLQAAHELKDKADNPLAVIHRDVSPHNILVGCNGRAYLTDFGIAKARDRVQTTRTHEVKGKLAYLAPERVDERRICTLQSDIFSMGVVLWECFAGRRLFCEGEVFEVLDEIVNAPIARLRDLGVELPAALDEAIARALSRDLSTRFPTARSFAEAISRAVGGNPDEARIGVAHLMASVFGEATASRRLQVQEAIEGHRLRASLVAPGVNPPQDRTIQDAAYGTILDTLAPPVAKGRARAGANLKTGAVAEGRARSGWVGRWLVNAAVLLLGLATGGFFTIAFMRPGNTPAPKAPPALVTDSRTTPVSGDAVEPASGQGAGQPILDVDPAGHALSPVADPAPRHDAGDGAASHAAGSRLSRTVESVRDGFTKLR
jgi:hypothetical protein